MKRQAAALILVALVALPVSAQSVFVSTVVIGMATRQGGNFSFSPVTVPTGVKGLQITMDLSEAPDPPAVLPAISGTIECSRDGVEWLANTFTRPAQPKTLNRERTGLLHTTGAAFVGNPCWNDTANPNRQLRGSASIGGTLRFGLTVKPL